MKRALLVMLAVALIVAPSVKAQSPAAPSWTCGADDIFDSLILCIEAPEPGMRRYITDIVAQSTSALGGGFVGVQYNTSTALGGLANCGSTGVHLFPPNLSSLELGRFAAAVNTVQATVVTFNQPLIVPSGKDLCVIGDASNGVTVQVIGYTAP